MSLALTGEQEMLREAAAGFLRQSAPVAQLRALRDGKDATGFDREVWRAMAEMGWAGVLTPESQGGVGLGHVEAGVIAEEMGRTLTASPFLSTAVLGATALARFGSAAQQAAWLPRIASGAAVTALAVDEGRKHRPTRVAARAERRGNGFRLSGAKDFVVDGHVADMMIVSARTAGAEDEAAGVTLFLVPRDAAGVAVARMDMVDSRNAARVTLDGVEVDADAVLGDVDDGAGPLAAILSTGRAVVAAEMSGAAQEAFGRSLAYMRERRQFGQPIGAFQALQHRAAHLYAEIELGRSLVLKALKTLDEAGAADAALLTHAAKAKMGQVAQLAAREGIQMHGGVGMTDAVDMGFFLKRVRVAEAFLGDTGFHAEAVARLRGF